MRVVRSVAAGLGVVSPERAQESPALALGVLALLAKSLKLGINHQIKLALVKASFLFCG